MKNSFKVLIVCSFVMITFTTVCGTKNIDYHNKFDCYSLLAWPGSQKQFKHLDINKNVKNGSIVHTAESIGQIKEQPKVLSTRYHFQILESQNIYNNGNFQKAAAILDVPYKNEPTNPFILNEYARALYRFNRKQSFKVYKELISILDNGKEISVRITPHETRITDIKIKRELTQLWQIYKTKRGNHVIIDIWFIEAYWKLGTLYLDHGDFFNGAYEIMRSFYGGIGNNNQIKEHGMAYLTESMFRLKYYNLALVYADETLKVNPENTYVLRYIEKIKSEKPE